MDFYRPSTTQDVLDAFGCIYRAVRAWKFYPKGHPSRRSILHQAHAALQKQLGGNVLLLSCGRSGFSFPDGEFLKDTSGLAASLAYELFVRRVKKITFHHDLYEEDLLELIRILCMSPELVQQSGGMDSIMTARGIRSIWVNEFDVAVIRRKRQKVEQAGIVPQGIDDAEAGDDSSLVIAPPVPKTDELPAEQQLQALLGRIISCTDNDIYPMLIRQAVACADLIPAHSEPHLIFPLIEVLADHSGDEVRCAAMQDCAQFALEQIVIRDDVLRSVLGRLEQDGVSDKALLAVLKSGGNSAITSAVELMAATTSIKARKKISTMLRAVGESAVPALLDMMHDSRWFIIRNICAVLGSIASREALAGLSKCLHHPDLRVRKEAIRSLAQLGGQEAEAAIIGVLRGTDSAQFPQAIVSLGGMKSRKALGELLKVVSSKDIFLKSLPIKLDALSAIASIGDRQATPYLVALLEDRHFLAVARGRQFKAAIAICLGRLGDARAVPVLEKLASTGGELGSVCAEAIVLIGKAEGCPDGIS